MDPFPWLLLVLFSLLMEGFFSGAEIAVITCDKRAMKSKAAAGGRGAALVGRMMEKPERLLGTTLAATNLAAVISTVVVTLLLLAGFPRGGVFYAVLIMVPVVIFWGEMLPKTFFEQKADDLAPRVIYVLWFASWLFLPIVWLIIAFSRAVSRGSVPGRGAPADHGVLQRDDLQFLLHRHQKGSDILAEERKMVGGLIKLSAKKVSEVMIPLVDVAAVPETASWRQAVDFVVEHAHSRLPVFRERIVNIVGIVHHFDLLHAPDKAQGISSLVRPAFYVPETKRVLELFLFMKKSGNSMAVAVDEYGGATGIITLEDILEEIVGEIEDEYDLDRLLVRKIGPSSYVADARIEVEELIEKFSLAIPKGDYETLGGFLMTRMGKIPQEGEILRMPNLTITVEKATPRSVVSVRLDVT